MEQLKEFIKSGDAEKAAERVKALLDEGNKPESIMKNGMISAMDEVGVLFQEGEYFLPEMLVAARAMKRSMEVIRPVLVESGVESIGKVVVGTVKGDLHDIGKNLVGMTLEGAGFEVIDLGTDVESENFVGAVKEHQPQLIAMSALLTTTMYSMKDVMEALKEAGVRERVKVMIGGAPIRQDFADEIEADYFGPDAASGKDYARQAVSREA